MNLPAEDGESKNQQIPVPARSAGSLLMSIMLPVLVGGEAMFDFIATEASYGLGGSRTFQKRAGGSPFNIAVGVRRLGVPVSFVGKLGVDRFGDALVDFLIAESIDVTHVVRESDDELLFLIGTAGFDSAVRALPIRDGALVFVTLGPKGASVYRNGAKLADAAGFNVKAVETTGCADYFTAAVLAAAAGCTIDELAQIEPNALHSTMRFVNAAAAVVATRVGAGEPNPNRQEVEQFLADNRVS